MQSTLLGHGFTPGQGCPIAQSGKCCHWHRLKDTPLCIKPIRVLTAKSRPVLCRSYLPRAFAACPKDVTFLVVSGISLCVLFTSYSDVLIGILRVDEYRAIGQLQYPYEQGHPDHIFHWWRILGPFFRSLTWEIATCVIVSSYEYMNCQYICHDLLAYVCVFFT